MKVLVAGSRTIDDRRIVEEAIDESPFSPYHGELITGDAQGVDEQARELANLYSHIELNVFEADWEKHGVSAGPIRNEEMVDEADALIAIWDGSSTGTRHTVARALSEGLDVYVKVIE